MAPFTRLAVIAMLFSTALVSAAPIDEPHVVGKRATINIITKCKIAGTAALTFDDGPHTFTNELLDILKKKGVKATFFMNGNNYGSITSYRSVVQRAYSEGHQIASHTWDHKDLKGMKVSDVKLEMSKLDSAFKSILNVRPVYMRPPYGSLDDSATKTINDLGYKIVTWDRDTEDWEHPDDVATNFKVYTSSLTKSGLKKPGHIFLQHDVNKATALTLAPKAIDLALKRKYKVVTVGECLGVPKSQWYRS
ncbi:hypothetical protein BGZ76_010442 [Entomortierella beljakovae]|nr:hypothetical protein BGZ76_010442 [Entomortierella beljakovae]